MRKGLTIYACGVSREQRNIEIGRVALCNLKADSRYGKLLVIVDIVDMNRVRVRSIA
jgi:ribosomal protein L14E/L6E/L27E